MIRVVEKSDQHQMVQLFCENIKRELSYISHGEIQMGIALNEDHLAPNFEELWTKYLAAQIGRFKDTILVYEHNKLVEGFIIGEIDQDRNDRFGVVCDLIVNSTQRKKGIGSQLLNALLEIYKSKGIKDFYLESGVNNHAAHVFFEKRGFKKVSSVFRKESEL